MKMVWLYGLLKVLWTFQVVVEYSLRIFIFLSTEGDKEYYFKGFLT